MKKEEKELEIAKSYFQLAMIFATIAGFLVVAYSVYIQMALANANWFMENNDLNSINLSYEIENNGQAYRSIKMIGEKKMKADSILLLSILFAFLAILKWKKGKRLINDIKIK